MKVHVCGYEKVTFTSQDKEINKIEGEADMSFDIEQMFENTDHENCPTTYKLEGDIQNQLVDLQKNNLTIKFTKKAELSFKVVAESSSGRSAKMNIKL